VEDWKARVQAGQTTQVVAELLQSHYDPGYAQSTARNFSQYGHAPDLRLAGPDWPAFEATARSLHAGQAV